MKITQGLLRTVGVVWLVLSVVVIAFIRDVYFSMLAGWSTAKNYVELKIWIVAISLLAVITTFAFFLPSILYLLSEKYREVIAGNWRRFALVFFLLLALTVIADFYFEKQFCHPCDSIL